jgi:putative membrane protein
MGWGWLWPVILLVGLAAVAWGLTRAFRIPGGQNTPTLPPPTAGQPPQHDRAQEILRERYARGEISDEEFHERMRTLGGR